MVKVVMAAQISGTRDGALWPQPGGEIDLPADEAEQLVRMALAVPSKTPAKAPEEAAEAPAEVTEEAAVIEEPTERATKPKTVTRAKFRGGKK